jgi:hypothetical protein
MRFFAMLILSAGCHWALAQQPPPAQTQPRRPVAPATQQPAAPATSPVPEIQKIEAGGPARTSQAQGSELGYIDPAQLKALLHKIWLTEYRLNDLLSQVQPARWKISDAAQQGFNQSVDNLRKRLETLEEWRAQFEKRPENIYLGYETYAAAGAVLPRLDGVARSITQYENTSLGAQFTQAENQLFDLQQLLEPYVAFLLRNQEEVILATQNNLAACQNELGYAMRGRAVPAKPMKNVFTVYEGRRRTKRAAETAAGPSAGKPSKQPETKVMGKKAEIKAVGKKPEAAKKEKPTKPPTSKPAAAPKPGAPAPAAKPGQKK